MPEAAATDAPSPAAGKQGKRRRRLLMIALPLILLIGGGGYWLYGGRYVTTDNAYVHLPLVAVSPDVSGRITEVYVHENEKVAQGAPLFRLDDETYRIKLAQAEAALDTARLQIAQSRAAHATAVAQLEAARGIAAVQDKELERQQQLTTRGVGSQASLDDATMQARQAHNAVAVAERQVEAAAAALGGDPATETDALPAVKAAIATRDAAARDLDKTTVKAASAGTVSQLGSLNVGQYVTAGTEVATLVDSADTWIEANFKETQLAGLVPGQSVGIEVDAYPDLELRGHLDSLGAATGSQFSLIPAQNATGNWVKVVQRVPVRITLDDAPARELASGMSVHVAVDTGHNRLDALR
ncbi:hypothetical protein ATO6_19100 [Oceanicola sp. 22II-s10i]|nr:hypothetical protein ATO6_19100 [Oceanicola sp. 22II-s10i]